MSPLRKHFILKSMIILKVSHRSIWTEFQSGAKRIVSAVSSMKKKKLNVFIVITLLKVHIFLRLLQVWKLTFSRSSISSSNLSIPLEYRWCHWKGWTLNVPRRNWRGLLAGDQELCTLFEWGPLYHQSVCDLVKLSMFTFWLSQYLEEKLLHSS